MTSDHRRTIGCHWGVEQIRSDQVKTSADLRGPWRGRPTIYPGLFSDVELDSDHVGYNRFPKLAKDRSNTPAQMDLSKISFTFIVFSCLV